MSLPDEPGHEEDSLNTAAGRQESLPADAQQTGTVTGHGSTGSPTTNSASLMSSRCAILVPWPIPANSDKTTATETARPRDGSSRPAHAGKLASAGASS
jgi:hypothetical protein